MKKNLISIIIIALLVVNVVLSSIIMFRLVPSLKKTDNLITNISSVLDLELESNATNQTESVSIDKLEVYDIADKLTINLKQGSDSVSHYAVVSVSFSMNTEHPDYEKYKDTISTKESLMKNQINKVFASYTIEEVRDNTQGIQEQLLTSFQSMFDSDFITEVAFRDVIYQ